MAMGVGPVFLSCCFAARTKRLGLAWTARERSPKRCDSTHSLYTSLFGCPLIAQAREEKVKSTFGATQGTYMYLPLLVGADQISTIDE